MKRVTRSVLPGLLALGLIVEVKSAGAAAGSLDPTFGTGGVTVVSFAGGVGILSSIVAQSDGKILVLAQAGTTGSAVLRFTTTGALDTGFGSTGIAALPTSIGGGMMLQANGQIVIGGVTSLSAGGAALAAERLNTDGSLDTSFGSGGLAVVGLGIRAPGAGHAVLVQPNGDILIGAQLFPIGRRQPFQTALARFTPTGALDTTFGTQGLTIRSASTGCTLLSSGDFLVVNSEAIAQFTANGSPEPSVTGGTIVASNGSNLDGAPSVFQSNGDYLFATELFIAEESRGHNASAQVLRFTDTGAADPNLPTGPLTFSVLVDLGSRPYPTRWPFSPVGILW